jgi:hypothetical protein
VAEAPVGDAGSDLSSIFEWLLALLNNLLATSPSRPASARRLMNPGPLRHTA